MWCWLDSRVELLFKDRDAVARMQLPWNGCDSRLAERLGTWTVEDTS